MSRNPRSVDVVCADCGAVLVSGARIDRPGNIEVPPHDCPGKKPNP